METLLLFVIVIVCWSFLFPSCLLLVGRTLHLQVQLQAALDILKDVYRNSLRELLVHVFSQHRLLSCGMQVSQYD